MKANVFCITADVCSAANDSFSYFCEAGRHIKTLILLKDLLTF